MQDRELVFLFDSPEDIKLCLNCSKRECNNCLGKHASLKSKPSTAKVDHDKFMKLYNMCLTDGEIARGLGIGIDTVRHYRKKHNIQSKHSKNRFSEEKFMELYEQKLSDGEIAEELNLSTSYICFRRQKLGLPANYRTKRRKL